MQFWDEFWEPRFSVNDRHSFRIDQNSAQNPDDFKKILMMIRFVKKILLRRKMLERWTCLGIGFEYARCIRLHFEGHST